MDKLKTVYNRGFSSGFFLGQPMPKDFTDVYGSKATKKKVYIGKVLHYYGKIEVAEIKIESKGLKIGDKLMIQGFTTGIVETRLNSMEMNHKKVKKVSKGNVVAVKLNSVVRKNDQVYVIV